MSKPKCQVCGGLEFTLDAGFYYCSECQTQSQDIREFVFEEYFAGNKAVTRVLKATPAEKAAKEAEVTLTSWEILGYILKGLVDNIMELGATRQVKIVTFQLWTSYLRQLEVAFMSTAARHKPRLDINFRADDAEIVYGVTTKQIKQSDALLKLRSKSRTTLASSCSSGASSADIDAGISDADISKRSYLMKLSARKKKLALAEYQTMSQESSQASSLEEFGRASSSINKPRRVKLTKHATTILKNKKKFRKNLDVRTREHLKKICRNESRRTITVAKLVALLRLALLITDQGIYTNDIFRWINEGHLSLMNRRALLPKQSVVKGALKRILDVRALSSQGQKTCLFHLCRLLEISSIPVPNLMALAMRYCKELQLPDEFTTVVCNSVIMLPKKMFKPTSNYEVITMSIIVVLLKMMFSLDGRTEHHMSELAKEIGRSTSLPLFVWDDWVKYIECRKEVVAAHHYPTHLSIYGDSLPPIDPELFFTYQRFIKKGKDPGDKEGMAKLFGRERRKHKVWVNQLKCWLDKFHTSEDRQSEVIQFPASLTPLYTYTQTLLEQYPHRLSMEAKAVLSQDFIKHSLDYVFRPEKFVSAMAEHGIKIVIYNGPAVTINEAPPEKNHVLVPRTAANKERVYVRLIDGKKKKGSQNKNKKNDNFVNETGAVILEDDLISEASSVNDESEDGEEKNNKIRDDDIEESKNVDLSLKDARNKKVYTLYIARMKYSQFYIPVKEKKMSNKAFEAMAKKVLSLSFVWLLTECARVISVSISELYAAVLLYENMMLKYDEQTQTFNCK